MFRRCSIGAEDDVELRAATDGMSTHRIASRRWVKQLHGFLAKTPSSKGIEGSAEGSCITSYVLLACGWLAVGSMENVEIAVAGVGAFVKSGVQVAVDVASVLLGQ